MWRLSKGASLPTATPRTAAPLAAADGTTATSTHSTDLLHQHLHTSSSPCAPHVLHSPPPPSPSSITALTAAEMTPSSSLPLPMHPLLLSLLLSVLLLPGVYGGRMGPYANPRNVTLDLQAGSICVSSATPGLLYWLERPHADTSVIHVVDVYNGVSLPPLDVLKAVEGRGYPAKLSLQLIRSDAAGRFYLLVPQRGLKGDSGFAILALHPNGSFYAEVNTNSVAVPQSFDVSPDGRLLFLDFDWGTRMVFDRHFNEWWEFRTYDSSGAQWSTAAFLPGIPHSNATQGRVAFLNNTQTDLNNHGVDEFSLQVHGWANATAPTFTLLEVREGGVIPNHDGFQGMIFFHSLVLPRDGTWVMGGSYNLGPNPLCFSYHTKGVATSWECVVSVAYGPAVLALDGDGDVLALMGDYKTVAVLTVPASTSSSSSSAAPASSSPSSSSPSASAPSSTASSSSTATSASTSTSSSSPSSSPSLTSSPCPSCTPCNCSGPAPTDGSADGFSLTTLLLVSLTCLLIGAACTAGMQRLWCSRSQEVKEPLKSRRSAGSEDTSDSLRSPMLGHLRGAGSIQPVY